jgi:hypothetical protein
MWALRADGVRLTNQSKKTTTPRTGKSLLVESLSNVLMSETCAWY